MDTPKKIGKRSQSGVISRKTVVWFAAISFVLVALLIGWRPTIRYKYARARAAWKTATLPRLAALSLTNQNLSQELETLKAGAGVGEHPEWVSDNLLLMTNGEYLIYASRHGFNNGFVDHLFLAHSSDSRWLYSTYHFCNSMAGVRRDTPPGSITEFATRYLVREFDGKSDKCLQHTWP